MKSCETEKHNKLSTVVEQHIITCVQNAFIWLWHMHQGELAISKSPYQRHFAGC